MPITAGQLGVGDMLFKHASKGAISQAIAKGQKSHYNLTAAKTGASPMGMAGATDITHVAMAVGVNDVLEFDEGGASKFAIVFKSGQGFVRGHMSLASRLGKRYEVFRCLDAKLAASAADKAELIWDLTHQGNAQASYGLKKMLDTAVLHNQGGSASDVSFYEDALNMWLTSASGKGAVSQFFGIKTNIQFFCSEFVAFCYMWAAAESRIGKVFGGEFLLGTDRTRLAPVELYTRLDTVGKEYFQFKGTLYA